ncbi:DUF2249 domain-containing protein [Piscinibacter terrae]|uniref:DUF2249 domain-containing protein n=1 Tax=Piscinibacter terrae TaxID=2496871 RepID=A0A3N7HLD2_9BURK|nr:DUF2249 domain-containing protein [Albitalea terrae]RQP22910.1 DUF2249 domain-containing protein [Albitalea terrae]
MAHTPSATVDVRSIAPRERHPTIFSTFRKLGVGQSMELVNDHDPRPLYFQFQAEMPGGFGWDYLEAGPHTWRVSIRKLSASSQDAHSHGHCCGGGSCSGA